jgi:hypothetical protein
MAGGVVHTCLRGVETEMSAPLSSESVSLAEALPREMARVRDEVLPCYELPILNGTGRFAAAMMRSDLDRAARALASGDVIEMLQVYEALKGYKV